MASATSSRQLARAHLGMLVRTAYSAITGSLQARVVVAYRKQTHADQHVAPAVTNAPTAPIMANASMAYVCVTLATWGDTVQRLPVPRAGPKNPVNAARAGCYLVMVPAARPYLASVQCLTKTALAAKWATLTLVVSAEAMVWQSLPLVHAVQCVLILACVY
jgi:hypothetical protein